MNPRCLALACLLASSTVAARRNVHPWPVPPNSGDSNDVRCVAARASQGISMCTRAPGNALSSVSFTLVAFTSRWTWDTGAAMCANNRALFICIGRSPRSRASGCA